ncbi:uncharacterized protein LOC132760036 [Ruditapes philippinarum]|uniref:uncharacterized protein LOC132760036 n=1 Tax=Ruditapes philippinarum TaxID=129788 RepID=UPI00295BDD5D|nr:uncharacterized protein LOC132760036 [Ruditapes philippinarum]
MKAEVLLRRRGETKIEDGSMELNVTMETEQYSPSDFINHLVTDERQTHSSSPDDRCLFTRQQGTKLSPQTVIRPIPILPIDSSVYTSPPTYIDNIQAAITVPVMQHAPLIASHFGKSSSLSLPANQESEVCSKSDSVVKSQVSPKSILHSTNDMLDCKWMNCEQQFSCMDDVHVLLH